MGADRPSNIRLKNIFQEGLTGAMNRSNINTSTTQE